MNESMAALDAQLLGGVFRRYSAIEAVYLFGSAASGRMHPESDVDLAVITHDRALQDHKLSLLTELVRCGLDNIDLVFPDNSDLVLLYECVRQNRLLYARADFDRGAFYSRVIRQYLDFGPYLAVQRAAYKERILHGTA